VGPAFVFLHQKRSLPSLSESPTCLWSLCHSPHSGQTKLSWGGEILDNHLVQGWDCTQHAWKLHAWTVCTPTFFLIMNICPAFFQQLTHLLIFPSFTAPSHYTWKMCLWISARWTLWAFKNCIANCTSESWYLVGRAS